MSKCVVFFSNNSFLKSRGGFRKWTFLKMSKIENPKIFSKKPVFFWTRDENAHNFKKSEKKM